MAQHQWHFRSTQRDNRPDEWKLWRASMSTRTSTMCWCNLRVIAACKYSETNNLLTVERRDCVMPVVGILRHFSLHQVHHATVQYPAAAIHARFKEKWILILFINLHGIHFDGFTLNLSGPTGGWAYGMPRNASNCFPKRVVIVVPVTAPKRNFTIGFSWSDVVWLTATLLQQTNIIDSKWWCMAHDCQQFWNG